MEKIKLFYAEGLNFENNRNKLEKRVNQFIEKNHINVFDIIVTNIHNLQNTSDSIVLILKY